jgi:hypothetical protein
MTLSIEHRRVLITIYLKNNLHLRKNRIDLLRQLALEIDIEASDQTFRKLINKWSETGRLDNT